MATTPTETVLADVIPKEMRGLKQWVTWKLVNGRKVPNAKSNDATTWRRFDEIAHFPKIGFVFSEDDQFLGIDLDGCSESGEFTEWSKPILDRFRGKAYCEVSPSGKGVKLTTRAKKPEGYSCQKKMGEGKQQIEKPLHTPGSPMKRLVKPKKPLG